MPPDQAAGDPFRLRSLTPSALVFAALVVATVGAFFVTTRLKRSTPVIESLTFDQHFSPNGDGIKDTVTFAVRLRRTDDVTISIVTRDGTPVRTLAQDLTVHRHKRYRFRWDGRNAGGHIAPDGEYHLRVSLRSQGRVVTWGRKVVLDTIPPNPVVTGVQPDLITPRNGRSGGATLHYLGPQHHPVVLVYRTDLPKPRLVARRPGPANTGTLHWDGLVGPPSARRPAPAGSYLIAVQDRDAAGNLGPAVLPPPRRSLRGHPGLTVRYLAAEGPDAPVAAGAVTSFRVSAAGRGYTWRVRWVGSRHITAHGRSGSGSLRIRAPHGSSGVALLELRAGAHRYEAPFAVQARKAQRVLVVLPTVTWQAENPVEENGDGYPDVLQFHTSVGLHRAFAGAGRPPGFATTSALLSNLRAAHLRYDITTDLALSRAGEATLRRYRGVLVAGSPRFAPATLTRSLASYVSGGGRIAWLGTRGFSRAVDVTPDAIVRGRPGTFLGEHVRIESGPRALVVLGDQIGFFGGAGGAFGPFRRLEPSLRLPPGARLLASAGADPNRPDVVVYRYGRGTVTRVGVDGIAGTSSGGGGSSLVGRIMPRLWALLSR